jgi:hypothetical protein
MVAQGGAMTARPPERDDLDNLLDPLLRFAQDMLKKRGEFYPFGATMSTAGAIQMEAGYTGSERPASQEVIDLLRGGMTARAKSGDIRASGICYDVKFRGADGKATDAIGVDLEHRASDTVQIILPYSKPRFGGPRYGEMIAGRGERRIFTAERP